MIAFLLLTVNKIFFAIGHMFSVHRKFLTNFTPGAALPYPAQLV